MVESGDWIADLLRYGLEDGVKKQDSQSDDQTPSPNQSPNGPNSPRPLGDGTSSSSSNITPTNHLTSPDSLPSLSSFFTIF